MKIRYGLALSMAIGLGLAGCASGGSSGGGSDDRGLDAIMAQAGGQGERPRQTDNTRAAEDHLEAAEAAGMTEEARTHYEQALVSAEAAIAEDERNPLAYRLAAQASLGLEDYQEAGRHFDQAAELNEFYALEDRTLREQTWIDLYQQAAPLVQSGDYEGAVVVFENATAIFDERPEARLTLGQLYAQLRQHDEAIGNLDRAVEIINSDATVGMDSATVAAWNEQAADVPLLRAQVLADAGRFEEASTAFRTLAEQSPDDLDVLRSLANLLQQQGDTVGAFDVYEDILSRPGLTPQDYYAIGVGFYQGSDFARAAAAFAGGVEVSPTDRDGLEMWARSLQLDSAYADVPEVAERWLELDPNSQNGYLILAQAVNQLGDSDRARAAIESIDALEVNVNDLQMTRFSSGGGRVTGSVANKTLDAGTSVALTFTFYDTAGNSIGTMTETVSVGEQGMSEVFRVEFPSDEMVGGYGYTVTIL